MSMKQVNLVLTDLEANALQVAVDHFQEFWADLELCFSLGCDPDFDTEKHEASMSLIGAVRTALAGSDVVPEDKVNTNSTGDNYA